uniref:Fucosyltransferase n=1 Tax=Panagrolaimus sp. JU765 TaxID=591449 RepID=A0AC34QFX3_9BILA
MLMRRWKTVPFRWKPFLFFCGVLYLFIALPSYLLDDKVTISKTEQKQEIAADVNIKFTKSYKIERQINPKIIKIKEKIKENQEKTKETAAFSVQYKGKQLFIEKLLTHPDAESLKDKTILDPSLIKQKRKMVSLDGSFNNANLGGCPDWNCELVGGHDISDADVVIMQSKRILNRKPDQLFVYYSQESPKNAPSLGGGEPFFNMTLGFRHDSPAASPYGYTVKLAEKSRIPPDVPVVDEAMIKGKTKGAAWYVSHCGTQSRRESLVEALQKHIQVDIYGGCGTMRCSKGSDCENAIDRDYHFYMALENSICEDYITEKLWNQGYRHESVPIVLKRSLVERYVPPNSFIAFDDYKNVEEMAKHLKKLMEDKTAYLKYFEWKREYAVIYLDGLEHNELERPWGFCQLCRLAHVLATDPSAASTIKLLNNKDLAQNWDKSCESDGELAGKILENSPAKSGTTKEQKTGILVESEMRVKQ